MKRLLLIGIVVAGACKTPGPVNPEPEGITIHQLDPFAVAEQWSANPAGASPEVVEFVSGLTAPRVERMHRTKTGYLALVAATGEPRAVLLTVTKQDGTWRVVEARMERADFLWPTQ